MTAHVHKACGLLQKGAGGDQKPVIKFVWPNAVFIGNESLIFVSVVATCAFQSVEHTLAFAMQDMPGGL